MISTAVIDPSFRKVAVAFQKGYIQINNIYSGSVLYNKTYENLIDCGPQEISSLAFFCKQTNFWIASTLWDGKVAFVQRPMRDKGSEILKHLKVTSSHAKDVTCIDITQTNNMATASIDNVIVFWNSFNGKE